MVRETDSLIDDSVYDNCVGVSVTVYNSDFSNAETLDGDEFAEFATNKVVRVSQRFDNLFLTDLALAHTQQSVMRVTDVHGRSEHSPALAG